MDKTYIYHGAKIVSQLPSAKLEKEVNDMENKINDLINYLNLLLEEEKLIRERSSARSYIVRNILDKLEKDMNKGSEG